MNRLPVKSSDLVSVGYDESRKTLEIEFAHGEVYQYFDVPKRVHAGLMAAPSHGKYFAKFIKKAGFKYKRV